MSIAILKEISSAEDQADQIEALARQNARDTVAAAKRDASVMVTKALEQTEQEAERLMKAAEARAFLEIEGINSKTKAQCNEIKEKAASKLTDAVDFIVGRIVKP